MWKALDPWAAVSFAATEQMRSDRNISRGQDKFVKETRRSRPESSSHDSPLIMSLFLSKVKSTSLGNKLNEGKEFKDEEEETRRSHEKRSHKSQSRSTTEWVAKRMNLTNSAPDAMMCTFSLYGHCHCFSCFFATTTMMNTRESYEDTLHYCDCRVKDIFLSFSCKFGCQTWTRNVQTSHNHCERHFKGFLNSSWSDSLLIVVVPLLVVSPSRRHVKTMIKKGREWRVMRWTKDSPHPNNNAGSQYWNNRNFGKEVNCQMRKRRE